MPAATRDSCLSAGGDTDNPLSRCRDGDLFHIDDRASSAGRVPHDQRERDVVGAA